MAGRVVLHHEPIQIDNLLNPTRPVGHDRWCGSEWSAELSCYHSNCFYIQLPWTLFRAHQMADVPALRGTFVESGPSALSDEHQTGAYARAIAIVGDADGSLCRL